MILSIALLAAGQLHAQLSPDSSSTVLHAQSIERDTVHEKRNDFITEYELTAEGDTIYHYKYKAFDFGEVYNNPPTLLYNEEVERKQNKLTEEGSIIATAQRTNTVDFGKDIGQIPFSEGMTPSGGKTYTIPIATAKVNSSVPQIAITYNSQAGNGVAGYGWNLSGASSITVTPKTIYYDNITAPVDLSKPGECVFSLDGTRLVSNIGPLSEYHYETAQGFILVKKHLYGSNVAYFTVAYPNGSTAIFGNTNNTIMRHIYPIREITDSKGYKINFDYVESGNNYYLTKISYGGKSSSTHLAEIELSYNNRTDYTTAYLASLPVSANKLLKSIVSRNKVSDLFRELSTYTLTHTLTDNIQQLTQIDLASGNSSLNPLNFDYDHYYGGQTGYLTKEYSQFISSYFSSTSGAQPVYQRGKFVKNNFGDGLITFPGKFSPYTKVGEKVKKVLGIVVGRYDIYGSGYPADQDILIAPGLSFYSPTQTIKTEEGFQTIQAVDVNGDGVDEVVKVNFNGTNQGNTTLKITVYTYSGSTFTPQSFNVSVAGEVNNKNETWSPMSRVYFFGDFKGTGKTQLLTVTHNQAFTGAGMTSYFALIDLETRTKLSEASLFTVGFSDDRHIHPLDMDGDGKMELCYATSSGLDVYGLSGNNFIKLHTTASINRGQFNRSPIFGDLNADGKVDLLVPPADSYQDIQWIELPVWAPHNCPDCGGLEPIAGTYNTNCKHCGRDLQQYYANYTYDARCRECGSQLQSCGGGDPYNPGYPGGSGMLCCSTHGQMIMAQVDYGYVNNGNNWTAYLSTGKEFASSNMSIVNKEYGEQYLLMDINGDGNADMLRVRNNQVNLFLNKNGDIQMTVAGSVTIPSGTKILSANVCDYYSMSHFIAIENAEVNCYKFTKDNSKANLLTALTDSYGNRYTNDYSGMTESGSNYYATSTYRYYPYFSLIAPLNLLRSTNIYTNNYTLVKQYYYTYYGAVMHRTGLGFNGFEKVRTTEYVENITSEEERNPEMFGVTTKTDSPYKTIICSYSQDYYSNRKNNPRLTYISETEKLTGATTYSSYQYDAYNNPTNVTQSFGSGTGITQVTEQTYYNSNTASLYLLGQPLAKTVTSTRGGSSWIDKEVIAYNTDRLPVSQITYTGTTGANKTGETKWSYDTNANVTSETFAPYNVTEFLGNTYTYDSSGRYIATVKNTRGQTTIYSDYDKYGNAKTVKDHKSRTTTHNFDVWGNLTSTLYPDGTTEAVAVDWGGEGLYTATQTATGQPASVVHYDALGRELRTGNQRFDGQWQYVDNAYDNRGRLQKTSLPFKGSSPTHWNSYTYDNYNRPTKLTEASGKSSTWSYSGLSVTETKNDIATTKTTDASGALISVSDPGGTITYALRPDGQPSSITAPGGVVTSFGYDTFGRQTSITDPSAGTQTFNESFTAAGIRTNTVKDANNKTVTTISDKYGRITNVNRPEFNTTYTYNSDGLLVDETSTNGTSVVFTYDSYDRPATTRETAPDGKFLLKTFAYVNGNVSSVQYESQNGSIATENFVYANGHNTEIKLDGTTTIWKFTEENALGQPTKATTGSINRTYSYTAYGMPTGRTAGSLQNFTYDFDVTRGNLTNRTDNNRSKTETFGYDNLNRLTNAAGQAIGYAANGNITSMPGVGTLAYENSAKPYQVTMLTPTGTAVPIREQSVTYTSYQRPNTISEDGITASFAYNAGGDRVKMNVAQGATALLTRYYIGKQYELDTQTNTERLYLGGDAYSAPAIYVKEGANNWKVYYIFRDYLGSITHIANSDGSLKQELSYDAWGRLRNPATQVAYTPGSEPALFIGRGYTGHEHLPWFGLVNMNARLYDPLLGRFLSPDPYVQAPNFTQNFNRYSYCLNNPLVYVDQDGEFFFIPILIGMAWGAVIGAATSAAIYTVQSALTGFQNWSWSNFGMSALMGGVGGALGGGLGALGSQLGTFGQSLGYNILSNVASNSATTMTFGGDISFGSLAGMVAGGFIGAKIGGFNGVKGGALKNAAAEIGFNAGKGAITGGVGGAIGATIDKKDVGNGFLQGAKNGAIAGATVAGLNILSMGATYKPNRSYGDFGKSEPVYRRGTWLTQALFKGQGITIGRNLVINRLDERNTYIDTEKGWLFDTSKLNQNLEAHETGHYVQQMEMGFANFYGKIVSEYLKYGFKNSYCTPGSLEWNAEEYAIKQVGSLYIP